MCKFVGVGTVFFMFEEQEQNWMCCMCVILVGSTDSCLKQGVSLKFEG
jgi:hypothetical protein